jgi:hypothetical protein
MKFRPSKAPSAFALVELLGFKILVYGPEK